MFLLKKLAIVTFCIHASGFIAACVLFLLALLVNFINGTDGIIEASRGFASFGFGVGAIIGLLLGLDYAKFFHL